MKKTTKRLMLSTSAVRVLTGDALAAVAGGAGKVSCDPANPCQPPPPTAPPSYLGCISDPCRC